MLSQVCPSHGAVSKLRGRGQRWAAWDGQHGAAARSSPHSLVGGASVHPEARRVLRPHTAERTGRPSSLPPALPQASDPSSGGLRVPDVLRGQGDVYTHVGTRGPVWPGLAGFRSDSAGDPDTLKELLVPPTPPGMRCPTGRPPPRGLALHVPWPPPRPHPLPSSHGSRPGWGPRPADSWPSRTTGGGSQSSVPGDGGVPKLRNKAGRTRTSSQEPDHRPAVRGQV